MEAALQSLPDTSPAKQNPEWCVFYNKQLYLNPGLPEVRKLVSDGVSEIVGGYAVDGIIFDDYFYPYPAEGEFLRSGSGEMLPRMETEAKLLDFRHRTVCTATRWHGRRADMSIFLRLRFTGSLQMKKRRTRLCSTGGIRRLTGQV